MNLTEQSVDITVKPYANSHQTQLRYIEGIVSPKGYTTLAHPILTLALEYKWITHITSDTRIMIFTMYQRVLGEDKPLAELAGIDMDYYSEVGLGYYRNTVLHLRPAKFNLTVLQYLLNCGYDGRLLNRNGIATYVSTGAKRICSGLTP